MIIWVVAALLVAQGVRLCMHVHHEPVRTADHHHVSTVHLESTLSNVTEHEETAYDVDFPLAALLKAFYSVLALAFALLSIIVLLVPVSRQLAIRRHLAGFRFAPSSTYDLTPPPRAPPR